MLFGLGRGTILEHCAAMIYLDYNATAPLLPEARDAWLAAQTLASGNPSSLHTPGQQARYAFDQAQARLAACLQVRPHEIIATSGGTEANTFALFAAVAAWRRQNPNATQPPVVVVSAIEHSSLQRPGADAEVLGEVTLRQLPVTVAGVVDLARCAEVLDEQVAAVCCQFANNELGTVQPIAELTAMVRQHAAAAMIICDAAQGVGKVPVLPRQLGVDYLSLLGINAGRRAGPVLYARTEMAVPALLRGGRQQEDRRSGTEDVAGLAALAVAVEHGLQHSAAEQQRQAQLLHECFSAIQQELPQSVWLGRDAPRLAGTLNIAHPGVGSWPLATR